MEIKSIKGWNQFAEEHSGENTSWDAYCKPGDLVDEEVYDYFLNILPPRTLTRTMLQVGEPHSTAMNPATGKYQSTYATFTTYEKTEDYGMVYRYCGNCFAGEVQDMDFYRNYASVRSGASTFACGVHCYGYVDYWDASTEFHVPVCFLISRI